MKKLGKILICLLLSSSFAFTGCSLVQRNTEKYLNRTVATAGENIEISKQDLITAYNNYGYQYVQYYGYTAEKAIKTVLDGLIDRQIVLEKAKELITENANKEMVYNGQVIFNKNVWQNALWQDTFDSVNEQIKNIENEITETEDDEEDEEESNEFDAYKEYEKKVSYEDGVWTTTTPKLEPAEENELTVADFVQDETGNAEVSAKAFKRYIKKLTLNYKNKNLTIEDLKNVNQAQFDAVYSNLGLTTSEKIAFIYELERIYNIHEENKYTTELQNVYERYIQVIDNAFNKKVVDYYKQLVESSYETYMSETFDDSYAAYVKAMQDDPSKVYYHRDYGTNDNGEQRKFVAVSHVLIKLSDEQLEEISELKTSLETGVISQQEVLNKTVVHERDEEGRETEVTKTVAEVMAEISADLANYSTTEEKAVAFNKYIYKYGQDTGMINATHYYSVNLDTTVSDTMTKNFADASRELANAMPQGGNLSDPVFVSQDNYSGYHIIFNAGLFDNELTIEQVRNLDHTDADKLYTMKLMLGTNKTMYDFIYDTIYSSTWSNYQNSIIDTAKQNLVVTYYVNAYEDLY